MGFIRGGLLIIISILLLISFLAGNLFLTMSLSLRYENVQPELVSAVEDMAMGEFNLTKQIRENYGVMQSYCEDNSEYVFSYEGQTIIISCDTILQGPEAVINQGIEDIIEQIYYGEYDCGFWDCLEENPFFLISEKSHDYWQGKFYFALISALILIALSFFLSQHKQNWPILVGSLLVVSSLPFMKLKFFFSFLDETYLQFLTIFISKAPIVFLGAFILGLVLLGTGIVLHFVNLGNFIAEKIDKGRGKKKEKTKGKETPKEKIKEKKK